MRRILEIVRAKALLALYSLVGGRNTAAIAWREVRTYFTSPIAYIVAAVFLALTGYFFVTSISGTFSEAATRGFLEPSTLFLIPFIAPILTMRLFAEEQKLGTLELLLTAPVRDYQVVLGKFLASFAVLAGMVALTFFYVLLLSLFGDPDMGPLLSGYLGFLLYAAAALSVGILASSLTSDQRVAAILGIGMVLALIFVEQASVLVGGTVATFLEEAALLGHFDDFSRGVIDTWHLVYYVTFVALLLFLTVQSLQSRRWR